MPEEVPSDLEVIFFGNCAGDFDWVGIVRADMKRLIYLANAHISYTTIIFCRCGRGCYIYINNRSVKYGLG